MRRGICVRRYFDGGRAGKLGSSEQITASHVPHESDQQAQDEIAASASTRTEPLAGRVVRHKSSRSRAHTVFMPAGTNIPQAPSATSSSLEPSKSTRKPMIDLTGEPQNEGRTCNAREACCAKPASPARAARETTVWSTLLLPGCLAIKAPAAAVAPLLSPRRCLTAAPETRPSTPREP